MVFLIFGYDHLDDDAGDNGDVSTKMNTVKMLR